MGENRLMADLYKENQRLHRGAMAKNDKRWCARITYKGKCYELGHFKDKSKAIEARKEAEKKYFKEWRYMIGDGNDAE